MARNDALRKEVSRLRSLVSKKIYRVKHNTGAHVSHSAYDPRPAVTVTHMTATQLRTAQRKFKTFLSRDTQFVAVAYSKPVPRKVYQQYKATEAEANKRVSTFYDRVKNIQLPGQYKSFTVDNLREQGTPKHPHILNPAANTPGELNRIARKMTSEASVRELTENAKAKGTEKWFKDTVDKYRETYGQMAEYMGRGDLFEGMNKLDDDQFALMVLYTPFMTNISLVYEDAKKAYDHTERSAARQMAKEGLGENEMWIDWASKQRF